MLIAKNEIWVSDESPDRLIMIDEIVAFDGEILFFGSGCMTLKKDEIKELKRAWITYMENINNGCK